MKSVVPAAAVAALVSACGSGGASVTSDSTTGGQITAGVGGSGGTSNATTTSTGASEGGAGGGATTATGSDTTGTGGAGGFGTIFTILLENHDFKEIVGSTNAPYINSLIGSYGLATNYLDSGKHPSLPNYLYLISGDTQYPGVLDISPTTWPYFPAKADNLGHQFEVAGIKWRSYQEGMGTPCLLDGVGDFAPKHDPFLYFNDIQSDVALCADRNVDYSHFAADLAAGTFQYMWITPTLLNDGHNPTNDPVAGLAQSDLWLSQEVPKILASDAYQSNGVLFITWDEAEGRNGDSKDQVPMIVISPRLRSPGMKVDTALSHASYLATIEEIYSLPKLGDAQGATSLMEFFNP